MMKHWMFPSCSSTLCPWTSAAASRVKLLVTFHTARSIPKQKHLHSTVHTRHLSMAVEHWIFPRNCLYAFSFGIGFYPSVKQIAKHNGQTAHTSKISSKFSKKIKWIILLVFCLQEDFVFCMCCFYALCHFD